MALKYGIVELVGEKGSIENIECGLLRGIGEQDGSKFIWVVTGKKIVRGHSLNYYNILSVVTFDGITKTYSFFMADDDEQEEAIKLVQETYDELAKGPAGGKGSLLDVSKFEGVPEDFGKISALPKKQDIKAATGHSNMTGAATHTAGYNDWYGRTGAANQTINDWNKDPEPHPWKRKTKKPSKKALEDLLEQLKLIAKREYKFTAYAIKGEKVVAAGKGSEMDPTDTQPWGDDDGIPFCGC